MDEAWRASDKVLKKAASDKQIPITSIIFCSIIIFSHTLVYMGNMETAAAFSSIGLSTAGWSGVGVELADTLARELEEVLKDVAHMLTVAIGEIMTVQEIIDFMTGMQSKAIDVVMDSKATQALLLLEAHGLMDSSTVNGVSGMIAKSMSTSVEKMSGTIKEAIKGLLDKLKPALIQVGKFIIKFGAKVQEIIESFSVSLDRVQKAFDQVMASMSSGGANEALMLHQTFHMFDSMNTGVVSVDGLQDVAKLYDVPALQGNKSVMIVKKYDADKSGDLDHKEFLNLVHGGDIPNILSVVLRSFAKSLAKVAGQVGGSKFRAEIASDTCDYLELMTAKNHTKVDWISDHLGNGSLPLPFVSGVLITLALKLDDPNTHKTVPTGPYVVSQIMKLHPKGFAKAFDLVSNASFYASQGYNPDMHATVVKRLTNWTLLKNPYEGIALTQTADAAKLLDDEAYVGADGDVDIAQPTMMVERQLADSMVNMAYKVAESNMRAHMKEIEAEHRIFEEEFMQSGTAQYLFMHLQGGQRASVRKGGGGDAANPAIAATRTQILALPATLKFAKWLSWNATHTAKLFNEWSFKYQKTSSNAIDAFATQVQSMVKKIQGFIKMMMKYSTPEGIDNLENILIDYAESQMKAMLYVTKKRVNVMANDLGGFEAFSAPEADLAEKIDKALSGPLKDLAPGVASELRNMRNSNNVPTAQLAKEVTELYKNLAESSLLSVSTTLTRRVDASFVHIQLSSGIKELHSQGLGSVDQALVASLENDVNIALEHARNPTLEMVSDNGVPEAIEETLAVLVEDAIMLLHALTHALPQASKALIFAKKEVSMLSKTLDNIFKVFEVKGPEIFDAIDHFYAKIWQTYYFLMLVLPCTLLFYAFWAGGFFGGPGTAVDQEKVRRPNSLAKLCGCIEDCCRCVCYAHEMQGWGGAECCFWSVCLFLQLLVLLLFIMAILISLIAAVQMFLAAGCAQIYLLGDQSICGNVLSSLRLFLDTIFPGLTDFPNHCTSKNLLMCELISAKFKSAADYTVIGSFLAATFTFQMLVESGQLHSRALSRVRMEQEWHKRHPHPERPSEKRKREARERAEEGAEAEEAAKAEERGNEE
jgi:hypothetical protein